MEENSWRINTLLQIEAVVVLIGFVAFMCDVFQDVTSNGKKPKGP